MLQSIQYVGSGPPTYVYSNNATSASNMFFQVLATETHGYRSGREQNHKKEKLLKQEAENEVREEEFRVLETSRKENLQEVYNKQYGKRESFLWKQR